MIVIRNAFGHNDGTIIDGDNGVDADDDKRDMDNDYDNYCCR